MVLELKKDMKEKEGGVGSKFQVIKRAVWQMRDRLLSIDVLPILMLFFFYLFALYHNLAYFLFLKSNSLKM